MHETVGCGLDRQMNKLDPKAVHFQIEPPGVPASGCTTTCDADQYGPVILTTILEQVTCDDCRYIVNAADRAIAAALAGRKPS